MKFVFHTNSVSPHQLPLAREIVKSIGVGNYRYVYTTPRTDERKKLGWANEDAEWIVCEKEAPEICREWLDSCDVLMSGIREVGLFERRAKAGLKTIYASERWFKPRLGIFRLLVPSYFRMARRIVRLLEGSEYFWYFPMGVHAASDMARLCGLSAVDLQYLVRTPKLEFERKPGGKIYLREQGTGNGKQDGKYCLDKMRMWGYFVEDSQVRKFESSKVQKLESSEDNYQTIKPSNHQTLKVLWVGRLLGWKRVDTLIRAIGASTDGKRRDSLPKITLDIYGSGPAETGLKKMASKYGDLIKFYPPVPIAEIRRLMREHDVYVLASNGQEGWGAVVSEALEEGMRVIGTYEAGSSATILPKENLFHAGDWRRLKSLLVGEIAESGIGLFTAESSARFIFTICEKLGA